MDVFPSFKHILLPTDGTAQSLRSVQAGLGLAKAFNAKVTSLFVSRATYIDDIDGADDKDAELALSLVLDAARASGLVVDCITVQADAPQDGIVRVASEKDCDLIVMATHGRSKLGKFFLGSVAASVLADCDIPVVLFR
jgi:nucleotide-binding universal stress UspA family protein